MTHEELRSRLTKSLETQWRNRLKSECQEHISQIKEQDEEYFSGLKEHYLDKIAESNKLKIIDVNKNE